MTIDPDIAARIRSLNIVSLALMASGVIYAVVLFILPAEAPQPDTSSPLALPLAFVAVSTAVMSFVVPRILARQPIPPTESATQELRAAVARYFSRTILALSLCEAIILLGFVLGFVGKQPTAIVPFLLAGEALMLVHFPRIQRIEGELSPAAQVLLSQLTD